MPTDHADEALGPGERAELARLRAEVDILRSQVKGREGLSRSGRSVLSAVLIALGCVLLLPAVTAGWLDSVVTDTDRYVATTARLADNAAIQAAVTDRVTEEIVAAVDVESMVDNVVDGLAERGVGEGATAALLGLAAPLADGVESWLHDHVEAVVTSEQFAELWTQLNRRAHDRVVGLMTGESDGAVIVTGDTVTLELAPLIDAAKQRLVAAGVGIADRIPEIDATMVLIQGEGVERAQRIFGLIDRLGLWIAVLAVGLIAAGVLVARDRRRAMIRAGLGMAISMLALGIVLAIARPAYLGALPRDVNNDAAAALFDQVVTYLRTTLRAVLVLGLVVAAGAFLAGPSRQATAARAAIRRLGVPFERQEWRSRRTVVWLGARKRPIQTGILVTAVVVFVFWNYPSAGVVVAIAVVAVALIALVEIATPSEVTPTR